MQRPGKLAAGLKGPLTSLPGPRAQSEPGSKKLGLGVVSFGSGAFDSTDSNARNGTMALIGV